MSAQPELHQDSPTALIVADAGRGHRFFSDSIAELGRSSITVCHPLEAIHSLQDESRAIGAVFAPMGDTAFKSSDLFAFLGDEFPWVRRIAYAAQGAEREAMLCTGLQDVTLTHPTSLEELAEALQPRPSALRVTDPPTFAQLDRRYRSHIGQLAAAMRFSKEDAEDIVQETLLGLFLARATTRGEGADALIAELAATSASASERGGRRRKRLRVAAVCDAATERSARESTGQPDAALLTAELANLASTAVHNLPGWCRRPFWLRAVDGQSSTAAGAALNMIPSTVDMLLAHARRRIAIDMNPHLA